MKVTNNNMARCCVAVGRGILLATQIVEKPERVATSILESSVSRLQKSCLEYPSPSLKKVPIAAIQ